MLKLSCNLVKKKDMIVTKDLLERKNNIKAIKFIGSMTMILQLSFFLNKSSLKYIIVIVAINSLMKKFSNQ